MLGVSKAVNTSTRAEPTNHAKVQVRERLMNPFLSKFQSHKFQDVLKYGRHYTGTMSQFKSSGSSDNLRNMTFYVSCKNYRLWNYIT